MNTDAVQRKITERAYFIIGTNQLEVDPQTIIETYKSQSSVERGFRFLKDPTFFAPSLYLKKPERIEALVTKMTMALLIYTIAQRRIRTRRRQTIYPKLFRESTKKTDSKTYLSTVSRSDGYHVKFRKKSRNPDCGNESI